MISSLLVVRYLLSILCLWEECLVVCDLSSCVCLVMRHLIFTGLSVHLLLVISLFFSGVIHERVYGRGSLLVKFKNHSGILIKFLKVLCSFKSKFFYFLLFYAFQIKILEAGVVT